MGDGWMSDESRSFDAMVADCRTKAGGFNPQSLFNTLSPSTFPGYGNSQNFQQIAEQYRHFRDWVFAAIRPIAQTIAGQTIHLARRPKVGKLKPTKRLPSYHKHFLPTRLKGDVDHLEKIEHHPLLAAIADPNELYVQWTLMFTTVASLLLTGKCYWWFWYDKKEDDWQIWPIPSHWMFPIHEGRFNARYELRVPGVSDPYEIDGDEVLFFSVPDPSDPLQQVSTLQTQAKAVTADEHIQTSQVSAFQRGLQPGLAIVVGETEGVLQKMGAGSGGNASSRPLLEREQRMQILNAVKLMHQGAMKAGEPMILDALISEVFPITNKPNEMDWMQSGQQVKTRIFQAFGVNPIIAGEVEGANRASAAAAEDHFCKYTVNPLAALMSEVISAWIGPNFAKDGEELVVWIEPALPVDPDTKRADLAFLTGLGALTIDQILSEYGYPPLPNGGDVRPVPFNITYQPNEAKVTPEPDPGAGKPGMGDSKPDAGHADENPEEHVDSAGRKGFVSHVKNTWKTTHGRQEEMLKAAIHRFFQEQAAEVATELRSALSAEGHKYGHALQDKAGFLRPLDFTGCWSTRFTRDYDGRFSCHKTASTIDSIMLQVYDARKWSQRLIEVVRPIWNRAATTGAVLELARIRAHKDLSTMRVPDDVMFGIRNYADDTFNQDYWFDIAEHTRTQIADMIADGIDEGKSMDKIVADVEEAIGGDEGRARLIARTETTGALNAGHQAARDRETGTLIRTKQWLAIIDDVTRDEHAALDGAEVEKDEDFNVGGEPAPYPGWYGLSAGMRCNCRCVSVAGQVGGDGSDDGSDDGDDSDDEPDQERSAALGRFLWQPQSRFTAAEVDAACALFLKFNPNHDPHSGEFSDGGGTAVADAGLRDRVANKLREAVDTYRDPDVHSDMYDKVKRDMTDVVKSLPEKCVEKIGGGVRAVMINPNSDENEYEGLYNPATKMLTVTANTNDAARKGTIVHELMHAVDKSSDYSDKKEWVDAWNKEIKYTEFKPGTWPQERNGEAPLSKYAGTSAVEGFAEFGRALFAGKDPYHGTGGQLEMHNLDKIKQRFPRCLKFWQDHNLVEGSDKSASAGKPASQSEQQFLPELFSHTVDRDGVKVDVLLPEHGGE